MRIKLGLGNGLQKGEKMGLIEMHQITKVYASGKQQVTAISNFNLTIDSGEFTVLAGPSGSGKSTVLNLMGGLDLPTHGTLRVAGCRIEQASARKLSDFRLTSIGFIFQAFNLLPVLTAGENAEYVLLLQGVGKKERRQRVNQLFEELGMDGLQRRMPNDLSGGQQQRVAIIRALASRPALILADEPTASLDSKTSQDLLELMSRLNKTEGTTFVFSSHDPRVIEHARRTVVLHDGCLKSESSRVYPEFLTKSEKHNIPLRANCSLSY
jgi:putative ABC transport system ATP-binding protein